MLQSASIRLSFWLLGTSQLDLHLLDCSIGMDAYCLMYYWFDLMSCTWGDMAIFIGPNVYYTIRRGVSPYSIIIESPEPHASGKKKRKWNGQPWPIYLISYLGPRSVVSWKFIEWDGWSEKCQLVQNYLVIVVIEGWWIDVCFRRTWGHILIRARSYLSPMEFLSMAGGAVLLLMLNKVSSQSI